VEVKVISSATKAGGIVNPKMVNGFRKLTLD